VTPEAKPGRVLVRRLQAGPAANARIVPVGADDPTAANSGTVHPHAVVFETVDACAPKKLCPGIGSFAREQIMECRAADSQSDAARESRGDLGITVKKADTCKGSGPDLLKTDAQLGKRGDPVRHDALAACFVNWWARCLCDGDLKPRLARGDGRSQACRPATYNENFCFPED
jgi:hypothetical protein